ncbi:3-deoxy-D-manno-octulosonate 8-phosphate phosphatase, YrbI family protein [Psychromonas ingrahamii 37]|uniref:3-deoxy-D-manno-octulosonate 8-phosphate phosphatase KdsC n=1 Tax=Psychromonas ingrahamii (strain DSM 17664 / CCUG 51855 / 37) TaxID=357804 RepID=A1SYM7_PSYIN|nr:3-deoxy-manno-octulosonate-8-phosphatase KdsC [Psychromonas ingrahamii]ABM04592.1 3-deoxy-D-manno-octulosonate 8-phosphate phosphatase, YrbI family protein [Psychromonas ingrahamii 37]
MITTPYGKISVENYHRAAKIKLLICDVDGVFSDGRIYLGNHGEELKAFHTKDGFGIKAIIKMGVNVAIITGRQSVIVEKRMQALGVPFIFQGKEDKLSIYQSLLTKLSLTPDQVAYIGDDVVDLPIIEDCGLGVAVQDAHPLVLKGANLVTQIKGGYGAVREVCDLFLQCHNQLYITQGKSE